MKAMDKLIAKIDKKLERFDPIWQAEHGTGGQRTRYYDKTGVAKWREWRGVKDTLYDYTQWLNNLSSMVQMVASAPVSCLKGFWEYRWMGSYLGTFMFIDRLFEGYRGYELRTAHTNMHAIVQSLTKRIALVLSNDKRLGGGPRSDDFLPFDEVLPPLFLTGFKELIPFPLSSSSATWTSTSSRTISTWPSPSVWRRTCARAAPRRPASLSTMRSPSSARRSSRRTCRATPPSVPP